MKNSLNPLSIALLYVLLYIMFVCIYMGIVPDQGGSSFEFFGEAISCFPDSFLIVVIISGCIYWKWVRKHWFITVILILIGLSGDISYYVAKYIHHRDLPEPYFWNLSHDENSLHWPALDEDLSLKGFLKNAIRNKVLPKGKVA